MFCSLNDIFQDVRGYLNDYGFQNSFPSGQQWTNAVLPYYFGEPYRSMFGRLQGASKKVQRVVYVTLPANTTVLIPSTYGIEDFSEPEMIEERPSLAGVAIASTDTSTPIAVTTVLPHGYSVGSSANPLQVSGVLNTSAPWGNWFATSTGANTFTLNGSASDGVAGVGGTFYPQTQANFTEVCPADLDVCAVDGPPQSTLGNYIWREGQLQFAGATQATQLRITYYASGTAPTNPNYIITIDNCRDFLGKATAANAAASVGWTSRAQELRDEAYGNNAKEIVGLLDIFMVIQVTASQRGPSRRQQPFRDKRSKFGTYLIG